MLSRAWSGCNSASHSIRVEVHHRRGGEVVVAGNMAHRAARRNARLPARRAQGGGVEMTRRPLPPFGRSAQRSAAGEREREDGFNITITVKDGDWTGTMEEWRKRLPGVVYRGPRTPYGSEGSMP